MISKGNIAAFIVDRLQSKGLHRLRSVCKLRFKIIRKLVKRVIWSLLFNSPWMGERGAFYCLSKWTSGEGIKELFGSGSGKFVLWVAQGVENIWWYRGNNIIYLRLKVLLLPISCQNDQSNKSLPKIPRPHKYALVWPTFINIYTFHKHAAVLSDQRVFNQQVLHWYDDSDQTSKESSLVFCLMTPFLTTYTTAMLKYRGKETLITETMLFT